MNNAIELRDLLEAMDMQSDETDVYLDKKTMDIVSVMGMDIFGADDIKDFEAFEEELDGERFIAVPDRYDINEYNIMEDFIETLPQNIRGDFYIAIRGRGAFRRFKDMAIYKGVIDQWYEFKEQSFKQIAIEWCRNNDIEYTE